MGDTPSGIEGAAPERQYINDCSTNFARSGNACTSTPGALAARARRSATSSGCASGTWMTWMTRVSSWCVGLTVHRLLICTPACPR